MKKQLCLTLILIALNVLQSIADDITTNKWGAVTNSLQMSICLKDEGGKFTTNQAVKLLIHYRNVSTNETITIYNAAAVAIDATYVFLVISPSGKNISPNLLQQMEGSGVGYPITPNQTKEFEVDLSQLCKFDEFGTYKITAKKIIFMFEDPKRKMFTVVSNPINLLVVP